MSSLQHSLQRAAFGLDDDGQVAARSRARQRVLEGPVMISVSDLHKTFVVPDQKVDTLKERMVHPLRRTSQRQLKALQGISFEVHQGEFFGIVGRNGSGKSTLLKVLASIYRADHGRIRLAGRLAPFIELGVGFNPELTARENVELNGVMMGLTRREARRRLDAVLDFAELTQFTDLKLKNYSSGMMVRLAFAVMVQADADVMLVDEVLAVGDAAFAQKCTDVFTDKRNAGKTLVLVTHDMAAVQAFCDRALLIHDGRQRYLGDPEEAALRYYRLNFAGAHDPSEGNGRGPDVEIVDAWLEDREGRRVTDVEHGRPFRFHCVVAAHVDLPAPALSFELLNVDDVPVLGFGQALATDDGRPIALGAGHRVRVTAELEQPLVPGRYSVLCTMARSQQRGDDALRDRRVIDFLIRGTDPQPGMVHVNATVTATIGSGAHA
jgi:ABC-type polysaccharide/polyol phosphate transport system ATPase subunit